MQYKTEIKKGQKEDFVIYAKEKSALLLKIEELIETADSELLGYSESNIIKLDASEVYCFFIEAGRVYAITEKERWQVKERLYRLEEKYSDTFVKINQSCLVNLSKITRFSTSVGGSLMVILKNGHRDYVSRRQLKAVKERLGL